MWGGGVRNRDYTPPKAYLQLDLSQIVRSMGLQSKELSSRLQLPNGRFKIRPDSTQVCGVNMRESLKKGWEKERDASPPGV